MQMRLRMRAPVGGRLIPRHQIRERPTPQRIEFFEHGLERTSEIVALFGAERGKIAYRLTRRYPHFVGIPRPGGDKSHRMRSQINQPVFFPDFEFDIMLQQSLAHLPVIRDLLTMHLLRHRRDEGIGVNLTVGMMQGHAYLHPAIFERQYIGDIFFGGERRGTLSPHFQQQFDMIQWQSAQFAGGVLGENHHFALTVSRQCRHYRFGRIVRRLRQRWETILENGDIVISRRQFGGIAGVARHGQRIIFGRRHERTALPIACVSNPFAAKRVPAKMRIGMQRFACRAGRNNIIGDGPTAVQPKRAPVRFG